MPKISRNTISNKDAMRYNRHIVLPNIDLEGQEALLNARVLIVGMGGLGNAAATSLCASGVGEITLVDFDKVDVTNLHRQTLFNETSAGLSKVKAAREQLVKMNSHCAINAIEEAFSLEHEELIKHCDIVLDCTDNADSRDLINTLCYANNTPLVSGAAIRFEGQLFVAIPGKSKCYGCLRKFFTAPNLSCVESGIFSPVATIIGSYQAMLAMQIMMEFKDIPLNTLLTFDALTHDWQRWQLPNNTACEICNA